MSQERECEKCHTTKNITEHHPEGSHKGSKVYLCRPCHDEEDGMNPRRKDVNACERRIRRALRRLERDIRIVEEAEVQLGILEGLK